MIQENYVEESTTEESSSTEIPKDSPTWKKVCAQLLASSLKELQMAGYGFGVWYPYSSYEIDSLDRRPGAFIADVMVDQEQIHWIATGKLIAFSIGLLLSGVLQDYLGTQQSMKFTTMIYSIAWVGFKTTHNSYALYTIVYLLGFTGGVLYGQIYVYLAEIAQPGVRGILSTVTSMATIIGAVTYRLTWNYYDTNIQYQYVFIFSFICMLDCYIMHESPYWLIHNGQFDDAKASLCWMRGWCHPQYIEDEYNAIFKSLYKKPPEEHDENEPSSREKYKLTIEGYNRKAFYLPSLVITMAFLICQFSGVNEIVSHKEALFCMFKIPIDAFPLDYVILIIEFGGVLMAFLFIKSVGKRTLALISAFGCGVCFILIGLYTHNYTHFNQGLSQFEKTINATVFDPYYCKTIDVDSDNNLWIIPMILLTLFIIFAYMGVRIIPWILVGEMFATHTRLMGPTLVILGSHVLRIYANKLFCTLSEDFSLAASFYSFAGFNLVGFVLYYFFLPETEGKFLYEIEAFFQSVKIPYFEKFWANNTQDEEAVDTDSNNNECVHVVIDMENIIECTRL